MQFTRFPGHKGKFAGEGTTAPQVPGIYIKLHRHTITIQSSKARLNILKF